MPSIYFMKNADIFSQMENGGPKKRKFPAPNIRRGGSYKYSSGYGIDRILLDLE